jgi:uncharacterized spore protein YtfJ
MRSAREAVTFEEVLNRIGELHQRATVKAVFGEPYQIDGRTIIPIAKVAYGYGLGGARANGREAHPPDETPGIRHETEPGSGGAAVRPGSGAGGGGGAGISARPVAVLEVSAAETKVRPIVDVTRLALAGMALVAWNVFWITYTVRRVRR